VHDEVGGVVTELFVTEQAAERHGDLVARARSAGVAVRPAADRVVAAIADTVTPQGVVAVCRSRGYALADVVSPTARVVAGLVDVAEPGNAGTVIRVADAAGATGVALTGRTVDPYNGKCVRASAGSLFHLPVITVSDPLELIEAARGAGLRVLAATGLGEVDLDDAAESGALVRPTLWLFGSEAHGLPGGVADAADARVRIPIHGRAESLNLATAVAVCLYASARARRREAAASASTRTDPKR
jgi:TrmH family RNA methyltransferase